MKILLLTYRGNPFCGGQGVYTTHLALELARMGHEVHCLHGPPYAIEHPGVTWHRADGLNLYGANGAYPPADRPLAAFRPTDLLERVLALGGQFPEMTGFSLRAFAAVRRLTERHRFDVVHDNQTLGWGLLGIQALGLPVVATIHHPLHIDRSRGFDPPVDLARRLGSVRFHPLIMQGIVARRMRHVVTVSQASAQAIARYFRLPPERIHVVYNGVNAQNFRPRPDIARVPGRVLFVGNLEDGNKGARYLLRAMARLPAATHLVIATGNVADPQRLRQTLEGLGISDRVTLKLGMDAQALVELYATAEVAVSPSIFEGFGFPAAEAMACGLPLVAARGGALPEVVGDAGVLVPVADEVALADAIGALLADPDRRAALGQAARERVLERFRWPEAAAATLEVYEEAIRAHH